MGWFLTGGTGLGLCSVMPPQCRGNVLAGAAGRSRGAGGAEEGPWWLPAASLFLASEAFGPRRWVSLPGWFVLKSLLLLIRQKVGPGSYAPVIPQRQMLGEIPKPWSPEARLKRGSLPVSGSCLRSPLRHQPRIPWLRSALQAPILGLPAQPWAESRWAGSHPGVGAPWDLLLGEGHRDAEAGARPVCKAEAGLLLAG